MGGEKNFDGFEPIFGEAEAEAEAEEVASSSAVLRPFVFYVHAIDSSRLEIAATDFHSITWKRILTVDHLEDLRDDVGIGGSWSEFVDYLVASLSSNDVKLILGFPNVKVDLGPAHAKLIVRKSKGLPRVSLPLDRLMDPTANDVVANLSLALIRAFKAKHDIVLKEQEHSLRLKGILSSERDKKEDLQKQLDALSFLSKRKFPKSKSSDKSTLASDTLSEYSATLASEAQEPSEVPSTKDNQSTRVCQRAAPVNRRAKVRGVSLQDTGDSDDN